jgi:HK97 family phage prohead protease
MDARYLKALIDPKSDDDGGYVSFIASTSEVDRMGDVIRQDGWELDRYRANPIVLFGHDHDKPIGRAHNVRVERGALRADIEFAPAEVDEFAAKIGRLVKAGFVRAVSVGFRPLDAKPMKSGGYEFTKSELLEISAVSVPANASALAYAKSFMSAEDVRRVFAADPKAVLVDKAKGCWLLAQVKNGVIADRTKNPIRQSQENANAF